MSERLIRLREVEHRTGFKRAAIYKKIAAGEFPRPVKIGWASGWPERDVSAWIEERIAERDRRIAA